MGRCPLIFIISDSSSGESNERLLFPKHLQEELHIENIRYGWIFYGCLECNYLYVDLAEGMKNKDCFIIFWGIFNQRYRETHIICKIWTLMIFNDSREKYVSVSYISLMTEYTFTMLKPLKEGEGYLRMVWV